ncbi:MULTISPECIES: hypothetical protein [unclassified Halomonas]|uniref:hypothetical protein n=1 Tax=unclassified Halomonas TaxID=2609666 RepID=UPI001C974F11|nr:MULTISPECIES: hypothetical protein [unclassified Halomonas]MBY5925710.1 hypothetical protein [Halomonas sp. DP4Y7-2]MBY6232471.1 hypothetical protein [Halomonas sp. DP4Y7-1]
MTLSKRAQRLTGSSIREILKITERADIISFAGGLPSPASFPVGPLKDTVMRVLADAPEAALQYGPTVGIAPLRQWVSNRFASRGVAIDPDRVLITSGSQQGLDLIGKCLIDSNSKVLVETPSYLGGTPGVLALSPAFLRDAFRPCGHRCRRAYARATERRTAAVLPA